jgi:hypothetical protein
MVFAFYFILFYFLKRKDINGTVAIPFATSSLGRTFGAG